MVPNVVQHTFRRDTTPTVVALGRVIKDGRLRFLNISILLLHAGLTALFVTVPHLLLIRFALPLTQHSWLYLAIMVFAFVGMVPLVIIAEAKSKMKAVVSGVVLSLGLSTLLLQWAPCLWAVAFLLWVYFVGFNTLEATLPSLISKLAPVGYRGTAMGVFSTHQFLGSLSGGVGGGWLLQNFSSNGLFLVVGMLYIIWSVVCVYQPATRHLSIMAFSLPDGDEAMINVFADHLSNVKGVEDMQIFIDERTAYLKVDKKILDQETLQRLAPKANL